MLVEPKSYNYQQLGGFLLNDVKMTEGLIIDKANYKQYSRIEKDKNIFYMLIFILYILFIFILYILFINNI